MSEFLIIWVEAMVITFVGYTLPCQGFCYISSFNIIFESEQAGIEVMEGIPGFIDWERFADS